MVVITENHPVLGERIKWTKSFKALKINEDCLEVSPKDRNRASGVATQLKAKGMEFISKTQDGKILYGRIK